MKKKPMTFADVSGPVWTIDSVAKVLNIIESDVLVEMENFNLLALDTVEQVNVFPVWQFEKVDETWRVIPGLHEVFKTLNKTIISPWTLAAWLRSYDHLLEGTPLEKLKTDAPRVHREAQRMAWAFSQ